VIVACCGIPVASCAYQCRTEETLPRSGAEEAGLCPLFKPRAKVGREFLNIGLIALDTIFDRRTDGLAGGEVAEELKRRSCEWSATDNEVLARNGQVIRKASRCGSPEPA
jgi:hypothetical protein